VAKTVPWNSFRICAVLAGLGALTSLRARPSAPLPVSFLTTGKPGPTAYTRSPREHAAANRGLAAGARRARLGPAFAGRLAGEGFDDRGPARRELGSGAVSNPTPLCETCAAFTRVRRDEQRGLVGECALEVYPPPVSAGSTCSRHRLKGAAAPPPRARVAGEPRRARGPSVQAPHPASIGHASDPAHATTSPRYPRRSTST
jgi:hypothetical protein